MKTALEILYKYTPDSTARAILERAQNPVVRADKENRALQMELDFPRLVEKDELYRIEEEVAKAIEAGFVPVSLGKSRLRTETAALVAAHTLNLFNQK